MQNIFALISVININTTFFEISCCFFSEFTLNQFNKPPFFETASKFNQYLNNSIKKNRADKGMNTKFMVSIHYTHLCTDREASLLFHLSNNIKHRMSDY